MEYEVKFSKLAKSQLIETASYISNVLLAPTTAEKWLDTLQNSIFSLNALPNRYPLVEEKKYKLLGVRKMPVKGFLVYYIVNSDTFTVTVTAVSYGKRDQISALKELD